MLDRLLDLLLVLAIRSDFQRSRTAPRWYRASADPRLGAALQAMHENAAHPWTVPELAAISGLSRADFARAGYDVSMAWLMAGRVRRVLAEEQHVLLTDLEQRVVLEHIDAVTHRATRFRTCL